MTTAFNDARQKTQVESFQEKPAPKFGAGHLEERIADLEKRVAILESHFGADVADGEDVVGSGASTAEPAAPVDAPDAGV
jgi:hypothetical protein